MQEESRAKFMEHVTKRKVEVVGRFSETWKSCEYLNNERLKHDIRLVEGKYESGRELEKRLTQVNVFHVYPVQLIEQPEIFSRAWGLIGKRLVDELRESEIESAKKDTGEPRLYTAGQIERMNDYDILSNFMVGTLSDYTARENSRLKLDIKKVFDENKIDYTQYPLYEMRWGIWTTAGENCECPVKTKIANVKPEGLASFILRKLAG